MLAKWTSEILSLLVQSAEFSQFFQSQKWNLWFMLQTPVAGPLAIDHKAHHHKMHDRIYQLQP